MTTCPVCGRPVPSPAARTAPFCSARCANVDLGRWFGGQYRVPVDGDATEEVREVDRADGTG